MKRMLVLVEGQTEEQFVKIVLAPWLLDLGVSVSPTILVTSRKNDGTRFKGGVSAYSKFKGDAMRLLSSGGDAYVTTLLDYYGLPQDFPGMSSRPTGPASTRVAYVENAIAADFGNRFDFRPFLVLHEFEAWLFASETDLPETLDPDANADAFKFVCREFQSPEEINDRPDLAPSRRITRLVPTYSKTIHGPLIAQRIGLDGIRAKCPHADAWFTDLESFARR
jgi:hypothetical protein